MKGTTMTVKLRRLMPLFIAGAAATAIAAAPAASAGSNEPTCRQSGETSVCQKQGHASIYTSPEDRGSQQPFGIGNGIPVWAIG
jgi:hypothetical protein